MSSATSDTESELSSPAESAMNTQLGRSLKENLRYASLCHYLPFDAFIREPSHWYHQYGDVGFKVHKEKEKEFNTHNCLAFQTQVTATARAKLLSWLIRTHKHFHLSFECCCLSVNLLDRFLAISPVTLDHLKLLGITVLMLASKQVETNLPPLRQLLSLCGNAFTKKEIQCLECIIMARLKYRLRAPTLAFFLGYYSSSPLLLEEEARPCVMLAQHLCEMSLTDYTFTKYPSSLTAMCALVVSAQVLRFGEPRCSCRNFVHPDQICSNPECCAAIRHELRFINNYYTPAEVEDCENNLMTIVVAQLDTLDQIVASRWT